MSKKNASLPILAARVDGGPCDQTLLKRIGIEGSKVAAHMFKSKRRHGRVCIGIIECCIETRFEKSSLDGVTGFVFAITAHFGKTECTVTLVVGSALFEKPALIEKLRLHTHEEPDDEPALAQT